LVKRNFAAAEATGRFNRQLQAFLRPAVLVVDEVGYLPLDRAEANMVFQLVSRRYERGTMIITSNKSFAEWGAVLGDDVLATAILDRLLHHCDVISINGPSYRLKDATGGTPFIPDPSDRRQPAGSVTLWDVTDRTAPRQLGLADYALAGGVR
jgi:DNA replication protein DnaC